MKQETIAIYSIAITFLHPSLILCIYVFISSFSRKEEEVK